jgi:hypothetical protein
MTFFSSMPRSLVLVWSFTLINIIAHAVYSLANSAGYSQGKSFMEYLFFICWIPTSLFLVFFIVRNAMGHYKNLAASNWQSRPW